MTDYLLKITDLNKHFGGIIATDNVNLSVQQGQIHAIIGPNGAGKTTLIAQLSGQLKPDSGDIEFGGYSIINDSIAHRARQGLARSFQITSVVMPMTLLENVMLAVQGCSEHSFRFWSPVSRDRDMQAAAMASLAMKPRMLLLDEPMAGMGKEEGAMMVDILNRLKGDMTILLVEHDMDAVFSMADRLSVLDNGHVIATDTVENIRNNQEVQKAYLGDGHA